eukprot:CAMPEP_0172649646 /NCGR_PEP_ID=MMETSP1068-20121228/241895_1 /TAXON_ID=35684 /ORGANISM="Pseudopedinella elastica, Strain CCMP716" /LENGTH=151 /DNA_ID=CAMNT_0013464003 /DNA_START=95 /DNA_END=551 /DNA_ORIENTATION=-
MALRAAAVICKNNAKTKADDLGRAARSPRHKFAPGREDPARGVGRRDLKPERPVQPSRPKPQAKPPRDTLRARRRGENTPASAFKTEGADESKFGVGGERAGEEKSTRARMGGHRAWGESGYHLREKCNLRTGDVYIRSGGAGRKAGQRQG